MLRVRTTSPGGGQLDLTDAVNGLRYSNVNPGGFEVSSFDVPSALAPDKGSRLQISDEYGIVWEGRIEENDLAVSGDADRRGIAAFGFGLLLKRESDVIPFVDRAFASWGEYFDLKVLRTSFDLESIGASAESGGLSFTAPNSAVPSSSIAELVYQSPGSSKVAKVSYVGSDQNIPGGYESPRFDFADNASDLSAGSGTYERKSATFDGTARSVAPTSARSKIATALYANGTAATPSAGSQRKLSKIACYGTHGLTTRAISGDLDGLYGGDIVKYLVGLTAGLNPGVIDAPTDYVIPHMNFSERTDYESMVFEVNRHFGYDWGTWDSGNLFDATPIFNWTAKQSQATWSIRRSDARNISLGSSLSQLADTVYVQYTDASGAKQEYSATASVRALVDAGISGQPATIDAGLQVGATPAQMATVFFALQGDDPPLVGSVELAGMVDLAFGGSLPAHHMRADGSLLRVEDLLPVTELYDLSDLRQTLLPMKRVEVDASGEFPVTSVSVDQGNDTLSVLTARFATSDVANNF